MPTRVVITDVNDVPIPFSGGGGGGTPSSPSYVTQAGGPFTLASNTGTFPTTPVTVQFGGSYVLAISGTFSGATIKLQALLPDGVTYADVASASAMANTVGIPVVIGSNASVRLAVTGGTPSAVYATLT